MHLSGRLRGRTEELHADEIRIGAGKDVEVRVSPEPSVAAHHATLRRKGLTYELAAEPDRPVWVNGERIESRILIAGDLLEIGRDGPILRFRVYPPGSRPEKSVAEAFADGVAGAGRSRSLLGRYAGVVTGVARELGARTARRFRIAVVLALVLLMATTALLVDRSRRLERRLARDRVEIRGLAELIDRTREGTIGGPALEAMRDELGAAVERLETLEARSDAPGRVLAAASPSVVLLQGSYGFVTPEGGEPLRFLGVDEEGRPLRGPSGEPVIGVGGSGPVLEVFFTGTAFVAGQPGLLVTNRHVALPWNYDQAARNVMASGFAPRMWRLIGFLPGAAEPFDARLALSDDGADLAVLRRVPPSAQPAALRVSSAGPDLGDEVIVLGYPAGIQALLARADEALASELLLDPSLDFWGITRRLAEAGQIAPLASRGIVAQVSGSAVVYDAETTRGGSGGPVLNLDGEVVAVTSAVVSEFGGSNIGVPCQRVRGLLVREALIRLLPFRVR